MVILSDSLQCTLFFSNWSWTKSNSMRVPLLFISDDIDTSQAHCEGILSLYFCGQPPDFNLNSPFFVSSFRFII